MRHSLVGLQLLLACVLVWGTSVPVEPNPEEPGQQEKKPAVPVEPNPEEPGQQEKKPAVPVEPNPEEPGKLEKKPVGPVEPNPEEPGQQEKKPVGPVEPNPEEPGKLEKKPEDPDEPNSVELEERAKEYRERMERTSGIPYSIMFLRHEALDFFHKHSADAFYRPVEDTNIEVKSAYGTILSFTQFLVNTNCTKEEGQKFSTWWFYEFGSQEKGPCVALPEHQQKKLKCRVHMFLDAGRERPVVLRQDCEPVMFLKDSDEMVDLNHFLNYPTQSDWMPPF